MRHARRGLDDDRLFIRSEITSPTRVLRAARVYFAGSGGGVAVVVDLGSLVQHKLFLLFAFGSSAERSAADSRVSKEMVSIPRHVATNQRNRLGCSSWAALLLQTKMQALLTRSRRFRQQFVRAHLKVL